MLVVSDLDDGSYSVANRGKRAHEDTYQIVRIGPFRYFAVFDGHGGPNQLDEDHVAGYVKNNLHIYLARYLGTIDLNDGDAVTQSITDAIIQLDTDMYYAHKLHGSTCTMVLIDDDRDRIYQVNIGDSRTIMFTGNDIVFTTTDHNPEDAIEKDRILKAGGVVFAERIYFKNTNIAVSRSFGDFEFKDDPSFDPIHNKVSVLPEISIIPKTLVTNIILTSDAPFELDYYTNQQLVSMANQAPPDHVAQYMVDTIVKHTTDDTTIIYVVV
jgi:serine/threonine protein phosphatase PrpC